MSPKLFLQKQILKLHHIFIGKYTNHKGRNRKFTNPEELEEERRKEEQKKKWRQQHGGDTSSEESEGKEGSEGSGSEEEESSSEDEQGVSSVKTGHHLYYIAPFVVL